jgi:hypothetical protein
MHQRIGFKRRRLKKSHFFYPLTDCFLNQQSITIDINNNTLKKLFVVLLVREPTILQSYTKKNITTTGNQVQQLQRVILTLQKNLSSDSENICDAKKPAVVAVLIKKDNSR